MIGNDVVDLTDAETQPGARHPHFDARVFTAAERQAITTSPTPDRVRWLLWAAKEAACKAARKLDAETVFSPARFEVDLVEKVVRFAGERFAIRIDEADEYVHVVAEVESLEPGTGLRAAVGETRRSELVGVASSPGGRRFRAAMAARSAALEASPTASVAVRGLAIGMLTHDLGAIVGDLQIVRGRIPHVELRGETLPVDLSLSHHGRFVACAFRLAEAV